MSTPDTIKAQLRLLLSNANETTKAEDATLTEANETLIAGYNQGGDNNGGINLQEKTITENGIYRPSVGYDGFSIVTVNVPSSGGGSVVPGEVSVLSLYNYGLETTVEEGYILPNSEYICGTYTIL